MEEFFTKYGVKDEHEFFTKVSGDSIFAMQIASDFFYGKFPVVVNDETVAIHPDHPDAPTPRVAVSQDELIAQSYAYDPPKDVVEPQQ